MLEELVHDFVGAKIHLIHYLIEGRHFDKNLERAEDLLKECDSNFTPTIYYRGLLNLEKKRYFLAKQYFCQAYERGSISAAYQLGLMHHKEWLRSKAKDITARKTLTEAQNYLKYAADRGHKDAKTYLKEKLERKPSKAR